MSLTKAEAEKLIERFHAAILLHQYHERIDSRSIGPRAKALTDAAQAEQSARTAIMTALTGEDVKS